MAEPAVPLSPLRPGSAPGVVARRWALDAWVVAAAFIRGADRTRPGLCAFALGDGRVQLADLADRTASPRAVTVTEGACVTLEADGGGAALVGTDTGRLMRVAGDGTVTEVARFSPGAWVDALAVGADGAIAAAAGKIVTLLPAAGGEPLARFEHPTTVTGLAFEPAKGRRLAAAHAHAVSLWWTRSQAQTAKLLPWKGAHLGVTWSPDGRYVVSTMLENALHGWRLSDGADMRMAGYPTKVKSLSWTAGGRFLATSGADRVICWPFTGKDGPMGRAPLELTGWGPQVTQVAAHPRHPVAAVGLEDGSVILELLEKQAGVTLDPPIARSTPGAGADEGAAVSALVWSPDGKTLAVGRENGQAALHHMPDEPA